MNPKNKQDQFTRPPVVVIMGHVDHGKSSILEAIKDLKILAKESGGITQHIGAYEIENNGKKITFIDTPGHEIFSQMRSRGARVADIAVLVVAADEGVKPQTKEAIQHIKEANIPFIVAINKIDRPAADPQRVQRELSQEGILVESMGGKIASVNLSAHTKEGIEELLDLISLVAEMEELKADITAPAEGVVVEAYLDHLKGPTATMLVSKGILSVGDIIGTSSVFGKVKNLSDFKGDRLEKAYPSTPVIVFGLENVPKVGENFKVFDSLESAKIYIQENPPDKKEKKEVFSSTPLADQKLLNLIIKADVSGSLEAIEEVLIGISGEKYKLHLLKAEVGEVNESDVKLAKNSDSKILAYRVKTNPIAKKLAEREKVRIITFEIVYELVEAIRKLMEKIVDTEIVKVNVGRVKVLAVFLTEKNRQILGGKVIEGEARNKSTCEIIRQEEIVGEGKIINLQRNKKETMKVPKGDECGFLVESSTRAQEGDIISLYSKEERKEDLL